MAQKVLHDYPFITITPCPLLLFLLPVLLAISFSLKHAKHFPTLGHLPWLILLMLFSRYSHCEVPSSWLKSYMWFSGQNMVNDKGDFVLSSRPRREKLSFPTSDQVYSQHIALSRTQPHPQPSCPRICIPTPGTFMQKLFRSAFDIDLPQESLKNLFIKVRGDPEDTLYSDSVLRIFPLWAFPLVHPHLPGP